MQTREAEKERIALPHLQVSEAGATEQQHANEGQGEAERSVVSIELTNGAPLLESIRKARVIDEAPKPLEASVRSELLFREDGGEITLDTTPN
jgi:hypothetical protein